ncbi:ankyrin repeat protein [Colletotrichum tofieldiae]|nr:ankyrin repeat protein [Colletotrichum tofieldiae]GKT78777.1 ankyrin repeat protein [Colletotrichum tofieldiae]
MAITISIQFLFALFFAMCVAADDGDDFSNNLFSDLAPLLALFGERVTMQFMSQSMGWADNIILAMAPLGIVTAIVGAIRVGGPSWLKAIIGRARENLAVAEQELMSSTSTEVCELWNGKEVVRCMGSAAIAEFICLLPAEMPKGNENPEIVTSTLERALREGYIEDIEADKRNNWTGSRRKHASRSSRDSSAVEEGEKPPSRSTPEIIIVRNVSPNAPNISLNSHSQHGRAELWVVAAIGTILQLGVVAYSGFATYYPALKFQKDDRPIARYAFPSTAIGTLVLVAGMLLCSHVIESSTEEKKYRPGHGKHARLVWLQQTKTVSD